MWPFRLRPTTTREQADLLYGVAAGFLLIVCLLELGHKHQPLKRRLPPPPTPPPSDSDPFIEMRTWGIG